MRTGPGHEDNGMTTDPEGEPKARFLERFLKENPEMSSRLVAAVLRFPRGPFFPDVPVEKLFGDDRPSGWGGRISPTLGESLLILNAARIRVGERVTVWRLTDPYFLLLLLELTHRVAIVEEDDNLRDILHRSVDDLGYAYIPVFSSLEEADVQTPPPDRFLRVFAPPGPGENLPPGLSLRSRVQGWVLDHFLTGGPIELS